jgi:hypothetical protein
MIFYSTADLTFNTTAPTGSLAGSGWQWVGLWGGFQGVVVGPHHFLTAQHVGGAIGDTFTFQGTAYLTTKSYDDTASELRVWEVSGTFPTWAPLYHASDEVGRSFVVMGRGLTRGGEIRVNNVLKGWGWGNGDGVLRWGENSVRSLVDDGPNFGTLLYATFDQGGGANEAHLATGDSSGPAFINDGTGWKVAGVAYAVNGPYSLTGADDGFLAAIFDARGLYYRFHDAESNPYWAQIDGPNPVPSGFFLSRVSARAAWIEAIALPPSIGDVPVLSTLQEQVLLLLLLGTGAFCLHRFHRVHPQR